MSHNVEAAQNASRRIYAIMLYGRNGFELTGGPAGRLCVSAPAAATVENRPMSRQVHLNITKASFRDSCDRLVFRSTSLASIVSGFAILAVLHSAQAQQTPPDPPGTRYGKGWVAPSPHQIAAFPKAPEL